MIDVFILGTSGSIPTLWRNLPSVALRRDGKIYLFDCGEATQIQVIRSGLSLARFEAIFISHLHGDHVTGLPGFLMLLAQASRSEPFYIYGPKGIEDFINSIKRTLNFYSEYEIIIHEIEGPGIIIENDDFYIDSELANHNIFTLAYSLVEKSRPGKFFPEKAFKLGIPPGPLYKQLQQGEPIVYNGKLIHPAEVVGAPRPGRKIVYAIDTRPDERIIKFSKNADLLIHDGMFGENEIEDARNKGHSTAAQAAMVAREANVKQLVLTHISSRYVNVKELKNQAKAVFKNSDYPKDLTQIEISYPEEGNE